MEVEKAENFLANSYVFSLQEVIIDLMAGVTETLTVLHTRLIFNKTNTQNYDHELRIRYNTRNSDKRKDGIW